MQRQHIEKVINYFYYRGQIFTMLEKYEQAYLSFAKAVSIPTTIFQEVN